MEGNSEIIVQTHFVNKNILLPVVTTSERHNLFGGTFDVFVKIRQNKQTCVNL